MKKIPLLLMGCGGVGRQLLHHIVSSRPLHSKLGVRLRVVGVCDSTSLIAASDVVNKELDDAILNEIYWVKSNGASLTAVGNLEASPGALQVVSGQEVTRKVIEIAGLLGKSTDAVGYVSAFWSGYCRLLC